MSPKTIDGLSLARECPSWVRRIGHSRRSARMSDLAESRHSFGSVGTIGNRRERACSVLSQPGYGEVLRKGLAHAWLDAGAVCACAVVGDSPQIDINGHFGRHDATYSASALETWTHMVIGYLASARPARPPANHRNAHECPLDPFFIFDHVQDRSHSLPSF